jgi:hypothetical protein
MFMERKLITLALTKLREEEPTTRDKWLTVEAWKKQFYICYDFDSSIEFSVSDFNKAVNSLDAIHQKVLTGNKTPGPMLGRNSFPGSARMVRRLG